MKLIRLFAIFIFSTFNSVQSQTIKTKDGLILGERNEFISICSNTMKSEGLEFESNDYCACLGDDLIPNLNSSEILKAMKENKMKELFIDEKNFKIVKKCIENTKLKFNNNLNAELKKRGIKNCIKGVLNSNKSNGLWSEKLAESYCDCAINKVISNGYSLNELLENGSYEENGTIFNEIGVPCLKEVFKNETKISSSNSYNPNDIRGDKTFSSIPLIDYFGNGYKVKLTISGVTKYFLLDTGSSDLIIDRDMERELLLSGELKKENYLDKTEYTLANNEVVKAQMVKINKISIGDYTVNNVVISIVDEGSLLCGKSFLDKFKNWEIDKQNRLLILYK